MKKILHGNKSARNRSAVGAGQLTVNTGMTLSEYRQRSGRSWNGKAPVNLNGCWQMISAVGLSTYGALSGLRASSFPNPVLAPPKALTIFAAWYYKTNLPPHPPHQIKSGYLIQRVRSAFSTLPIGVGNLVVSRKKNFRDWKIICTRNCTKLDAI